MSKVNKTIMPHKRYLELQKSNEPMSIMTADSFMKHPKKCKKCLEEAKKQKRKKS